MRNRVCEVAIVGAGPYGLGAEAHLRVGCGDSRVWTTDGLLAARLVSATRYAGRALTRTLLAGGNKASVSC
jgi:threonine dehydrogenase-like Zn-dependent dehydrogenase